MNIRELDEESRRTGVWPPRRIMLRVEDGEVDAAESVKIGEVDLNAPRAVAAPKPREVPPLPAPSLSPSVTPSRRRGLPGARGVTPAPAASPEDAEFEQWVSSPLPNAPSEPEYQEPPAWLPDDVRLRADRRHRRVARKARTQMFGASAATTLAIGGCAAALAVVGLSQTESVGGSLGVPSIGLFGTPPEQTDDNDSADAAKAKPAEPKRSRTRREGRSRSSRRASAASSRSTPTARRSASAPTRPTPTARRSASAPTRRASSPPAASNNAPAQPVRDPSPPPVQPRQVSNPPPPPAAPPRKDRQPSAGAPVVFDAPSQTASRPAPSTAPSRPVSSAPAPTTSAPAP